MAFPNRIKRFATVLGTVSVLAAGAFATTASAQSANPPAAELDRLRPQASAALAAAEAGRFDAAQLAPLAKHPAYPWIEYSYLRRTIDQVDVGRARDFLKRYDGTPVAEAFRAAWLPALARRQDWPTFHANFRPSENAGLRCADLTARQATGAVDAQWTSDAQAVWRSSGKSLPDACDAVFTALTARGGLPDALRWERIELAADAQQPAVMRSAARGLPADQLLLANQYAAYQDANSDVALSWPKDVRSRRMAAFGLAAHAKKDPGLAERQLPAVTAALGLDDAQRAQVLYQIALWTVASYEPNSARRLGNVPESAYDERLFEWRAREAMARGDWPAALKAIRLMPAAQRADSRWRYFEARLAEKAGERSEAQRLYRDAARNPTFHGFLAADRLGIGYTLCEWKPADPPGLQATLAKDPGLVRAIELSKLDRADFAGREWAALVARLDDPSRRAAVAVASASGWYDRAVFGLGKDAKGKPLPDELRLYTLRFPLAYDDMIRREAAKQAIDPAWVAAEIRAESIFNPRARSPANARGLMQVLPGTGAGVAQRTGIAYAGADALFDPATNIAIGTAYLRQVHDTYGAPYLAIAAYNAGPAPAARWQSQRPNYDPDFWIETISYKETREYVARVLAFSVLYDWRLSGTAVPLTERLAGQSTGAPRKSFGCGN